MAVEDATDRAAFVSIDDFGTAATYTPAGGAASTVNVIFDNEFFGALEGEASVAVGATEPRATARTADMPNAAQGDIIVIDGMTYKFAGVEPDGTGMTTLMLVDQS